MLFPSQQNRNIFDTDCFTPSTHPSVHQEHSKTRNWRGFPISLFFREKEDIILVVAVAHAKRRHGYWRGRV